MWSQALGVVVTPHVSLHPNLEEGLLARHQLFDYRVAPLWVGKQSG